MVAYIGFWPRPLGKAFIYGTTENSSKKYLDGIDFRALIIKVIYFLLCLSFVHDGIGDSKRRVSLENKQSKICPFLTLLFAFENLHLHLP